MITEKECNWQQRVLKDFRKKSPDASLPFRVDPGFQNPKLEDKIERELFAISNLRSIFAQKIDSKVLKDILKNNKNFIQKDITMFVNLITKFLQRKDNKISKKELSTMIKYQKKIIKKIYKISSLITNYNTNNFQKLSDEIVEIFSEISKKNFSFKSLSKKIKFLFKGYNGLGTSYIVFKKK